MVTRITIRPGGTAAPDLEALAERRFRFALGRFGGYVRSLAVRVSDVNGPRGGVDKHCLVTIRLKRSARHIVIEDIDASASALLARAADRAARVVARALDLRNERRAAYVW